MAKKTKKANKKTAKKVTKKAAKKPAKKKVAKKVAKKKSPTKKKMAKKVAKKAAKKVTKKKVVKKETKKKVTKKVAKKAAKKVTKKVAKKVTAKKAAPAKVKKETKAAPAKVKKEKKAAPEVVVEKLAPVEVGMDSTPINAIEEDLDDLEITSELEEPSTTEPHTEPSHMLTDEYNPDDEQELNSFGYGWSYDEGLDSPEDVDREEELYDEDAEYASGKPVGYDLERDFDDEEEDDY